MNRIYELRKRKCLTQKQLADMLGIDQTSVSHWERGKGTPDTMNQIKLANIFNVSLDYLAGRNNMIANSSSTGLDNSYQELIEYAIHKGFTPEDIKHMIDFAEKIKEKKSV